MAGESFEPYDLATQGQNSFSPFTLSVQGQLTLDVIVEDVIVTLPPAVIVSGGGGTGSGTKFNNLFISHDSKVPTKKKLKKIRVICVIDGVTYEETAYSQNLSIKLSDIKVNVNESKDSKPKIDIQILE